MGGINMSKKVLITAGLPYSNGDLHVGHVAGCYLPADITNRYLKMKGRETLYICGSDDHGVAIAISAEKEGKTPQAIADHYHQQQKDAFDGLNISFDFYGSTSNGKYHSQLSQGFFNDIHQKGHLKKETTDQFYDDKKAMFLPDRYVQGECSFCHTANQNGDQCENCGKVLDPNTLVAPTSTMSGNPVALKPSTHWFLDMTTMADSVTAWADTAVLRPNTKKYVTALIKEGLVKRSMTRDLSWGIPVPIKDKDAAGKVLYVWFDAPIGYISFTKEHLLNLGQSEVSYLDWWDSEKTEVCHFIGEDNTIFHCIIWIAMLELQGTYGLPHAVVVNNFLNIKVNDNVEKISKSRKNAIWIKDYLKQGHDVDFLRYYLTEISPEKSRSHFDYDEFVTLCNAGLADTIGNFINRSITFGLKFIGDTVPTIKEELIGELEQTLKSEMQKCFEVVSAELDQYSTRNALKGVMDFARFCNKYFNDKAPWSERKQDIELAKVTLYNSYVSIYFLAIVLAPFMPAKSQEMLKIFGIDTTPSWSDAMNIEITGIVLSKPEILFSKMEKISESL